jgi:predicted enzyme related to lactoylglutathione lyase
MTVVESHAPGTFCWADLGTSDAAGAKRFYTGLFGWSFEDRPMTPDSFYTMFQREGKAVCALYQQDPQQAQSMPPHWLSYISVESADASAQRAKSLGGSVVMEPFDVFEVGRMTLVQDPSGAVVALWEARGHVGAGVIGEPHSLAWNELASTDAGRAESFYTGLLGWSAMAMSGGPTPYIVFQNQDQPAGGMMQILPEWGPMPSHWRVYFAVDDCDRMAARAQSLGGTVRLPPSDVPKVGRVAMLVDPQGAGFAIIRFLPSS